MNKHIHSLVFDRKRGMRVPAAENDVPQARPRAARPVRAPWPV